MDDAAFNAFFEPRKSKTPEEIAREDALEDDIPGWPTPEYVRERLEELSAMPPSPDVTAEKLWLARPDEDLAQLATAHLAMRAFAGPTLADREAETQKAKAEVATLKPKARTLKKQQAAKRKSVNDLNEYRATAQSEYTGKWTEALLRYVERVWVYTLEDGTNRTQEAAAIALRRDTTWPDKWPDEDSRSRTTGKRRGRRTCKYQRPPSVRMIERKIPALEKKIGQALYTHRPNSKHPRCRFCPS